MAKSVGYWDPLFDDQWHLLNTGQDIMGLPQAEGAYRNDINVTGVWPNYTGKGVVVGVLDDGFQADHPDLKQNYLADKAYNFITETPGQYPGDHGTATTGLIVAANNGVGGLGVAYEASAIGYTSAAIGPSILYSFVKAASHMLQDGVDVSSNSWGAPFETPFGGALLQPVFNNVTLNLAQMGRDGLGTVTVFAAGNGRAENEHTASVVTGGSPFVILVAAANADGTVASYSTAGTSVLVAAPGSGNTLDGPANELPSIVTTDLTGTAGYNIQEDGDYTNVSGAGSYGFSGTSAAAPIVSGVVALMLEANPLLGYRDVQEILAYSARNPAQVATWQTNGAGDWNGGGLLFNDDLGFGLVDAHAAVRLAETWTKQSTFDNAARLSATFSNGSVTLASGESVNLSVRFEDVIRVQHALVGLHIQAPNSGLENLSVSLIGPDGTSNLFMDPSVYAPSASIGLTDLSYTFDTVRSWGQISTSGDWVLSVSNNTGGAVSFEAGLWLIGDGVNVGETFIYTDDYARLGAEDADRTTLSSTQPYPHTLNAAAVTSDTWVNLSSDAARVAGVDTHFTPSLRFGRVVTGDGNDTLKGDADDTVFVTGRGINSVDGGGGYDTLQLQWELKSYNQNAYGAQTMIMGIQSTDFVSNIAALQFADGTLLLDDDPLVNDLMYAGYVPSLLNSGLTARDHYDSVGWKAGLDPNGMFSTTAYLANHAALKAAGTNPLDYYHETGWKNGDDPSARFDSSLYLKLNPDVASAGVDPLQHYLQYGMHEGRQVRPVVDSARLEHGGTFDATFYLLSNVDVALAGADAYEHWSVYGLKEGRDPNAYFDVSYYLQVNPDVAAAGSNPLDHYMTYGWKEGRDPSRGFDTEGYLDHYGDVAAAGVDPLVHYLIYGIGEGRQATWDLA
ncbi:S8 family serine peptidase [Aquabacter sp. L1I39]|uniref:S8 family peptidase n=1 Tax=Aquabacter sp. L1I39 TaxID=2820278 RepID=UPI001ADC1C9E|nr:S8 family serine peptidase [Aquabacter sp. L1I39]QTL03209.1 S8 family serine peptidase [Aquabacter sp. L1I39]